MTFTSFYRSSRAQATTIASVLVAASCATDIATGPVYSPLLFYIPSIMYVGWFVLGAAGWAYLAMIGACVTAVHLGDGTHSTAAAIDVLTRVLALSLVHVVVVGLRNVVSALRASNEHLSRLNSEKDLLFELISHDAKSPLASVLASSRHLERSALQLSPERLRQCAKMNVEAASRAISVFENLIAWTRLQLRGALQEARIVDLREVALVCVKAHQRSADEQSIDLCFECEHPRLPGFCDRAALETVLATLIRNAVASTREMGRVTVAVRPACELVRMEVTDSGPGMSPERLRSLFVPRGSASSGGDPAVGLGLLLCKRLIDLNGGTIGARSRLGSGSTFEVAVPARPPRPYAISPTGSLPVGRER